MGVFGLGTAEVVIILGVAAFVIGPEKLGKFAGQMRTEVPEEIKKIPAEFQKGMEEGETASRARRAKPMAPLDDDDA